MKILLFGITRDIIGSGVLELPEKTTGSLNTVDELRRFLVGQYPELKSLNSIAIAVNNEYASESTAIEETDEIALIPPVSGG